MYSSRSLHFYENFSHFGTLGYPTKAQKVPTSSQNEEDVEFDSTSGFGICHPKKWMSRSADPV